MALNQNLKAIHPSLELIERQKKIGIGRIDLLARGSNNSNIIIELKARKARSSDLGQLLAYIGWFRQEEKGFSVKGILIAPDFDEKVVYAALTAQNIGGVI